MYYISQETYDQMPDELQEKALGDTRKYYKQHGVPLPTELITGSKEDAKPSSEALQEDMINEKHKADEDLKEESKPMKASPKDEEDMEEEEPKTWDDAHKRGMALIISIGKKPSEEDD